MEKKSIGQFIAVLRKANGMTQKHLAEKLNVSDKAISRWERDECLPDLTLIPVLAEIFGVPSDEILRGERANPDKVSDEQEIERNTEKTEKQVFRLLDATETKHRISGIVSISVAAVGLIVAMICNLGFNRAYLGFFISSIFYLGAVIYQIVSIILAFSSIRRVEFAGEELNSTRRSMFDRCCGTIGGIFIFFAVSIPLIFVGDAYYGLYISSWIEHGLNFGIVCAVIGLIAKIIAKKIAVKKGVYSLTEEEVIKSQLLYSIKKRRIIVSLIIVTVTFLLQCVFNNWVDHVGTLSFCEGTIFEDPYEFKEYIETPMTYEGSYGLEVCYRMGFPGVVDHGWFEFEYENGETEDIRYEHNNESVEHITEEYVDGKMVIKTYSRDEIIKVEFIVETINLVFVLLYVIEIVVNIVIYVKKKKKALKDLY